jgi:hypothetical protein
LAEFVSIAERLQGINTGTTYEVFNAFSSEEAQLNYLLEILQTLNLMASMLAESHLPMLAASLIENLS